MTLAQLLLNVRNDRPDAKEDIGLVNLMIAELKKPENENLLNRCVRYACIDALNDYHAQEDHHEARTNIS
jgi:hypothetical protein